jgi:phosphatidylinositol glycan class V
MKDRKKATTFSRNIRQGIENLTLIFLCWKLTLLVVACLSPGPGYDTSTQILLDQYSLPPRTWLTNTIEHLVLRLTRWDGIYFASNAARGHANEQDWAFSWVLARVTSAVSRGVYRYHTRSCKQ